MLTKTVQIQIAHIVSLSRESIELHMLVSITCSVYTMLPLPLAVWLSTPLLYSLNLSLTLITVFCILSFRRNHVAT